MRLKSSLSRRLLWVFGLLLAACSGISALLQVQAMHQHEQEVIQRLSLGLARHIADHAALTDERGINPAAVRQLFAMQMVANPSVEIYLLAPDGVIQAHAAPADHLKRQRVGLEPIRRLLAGAVLPIVGDDPRSATAHKVFSAAALHTRSGQLGYIYVVLEGEDYDHLAQGLGASATLKASLLSLALVCGLGLLAGWVAFWLITRRLQTLTSTVQGLVDAGVEELDALQAARPRGSRALDEIDQLEAAFARMAARISAQWREQVEQDRQRRELIANISHDLRTPLTAIHGYLETLLVKSEQLSPAERARYLRTALGQSEQVGRLSRELFELARLEYGAVSLELESFALPDLIQDVFQKFELAAHAKTVTLRAEVAPELPPVEADLGMIERVLSNLLDNAIRHTPAGGHIVVELLPAAGPVQVCIADTGPGIPAAMRAGLFIRPTPLNGNSPTQRGGLGLLIVHRILRLHGSDIALLNREGYGAVFGFTLQRAA